MKKLVLIYPKKPQSKWPMAWIILINKEKYKDICFLGSSRRWIVSQNPETEEWTSLSRTSSWCDVYEF